MHPKGLIVTDIIGADIPDRASETELFELVKTVQGHQFSVRYRKHRTVAGFILKNSLHLQQVLQKLFLTKCQKKLRFRFQIIVVPC